MKISKKTEEIAEKSENTPDDVNDEVPGDVPGVGKCFKCTRPVSKILIRHFIA